MFAVRDTPQDSMGFTPFELIYGMSVHTPLSLLRKLWTEEEDDSEVKTAYQYVIDLRERLEETNRSCQRYKTETRHIIIGMRGRDTLTWVTACCYCCQQNITN